MARLSELQDPVVAMQRRTIASLGLLSVAAIVGCGPSGPPMYVVQGEVRFDGQPVQSGTMTLIPKSPQARTAVAKINHGKYSMEVPAGEWVVNIQAVREAGPVDPKMREAPREQYIPDRYNGQSKLRISVPSEQKDFDYDLEP